MSGYDRLRRRMVDMQIVRRGVRDARVLDAMRTIPRERFVPPEMERFAYEDAALPIGEGQTISQPYIVAVMIQAAGIGPHDRVLEVGAGSGYAAALLSRIAARVFAIERHQPLALSARDRLAALGCSNVDVRLGDGTLGLPDEAPFDAILVAASGPDVPDALMEQLAIGGRLVMPVGEPGRQRLRKVTHDAPGRYAAEELEAVAFVPLIGEQGWRQ